MKQAPKLEILPIDTLIPYANNARTHSDDQIKKIQASLREFGFVNPVLIDANRGIIAGHGRIEAAKREGMTEVPCVFVEHLTDAQKRAYILADNRLAELAGWDMDILKLELDALADLDFDIALTGFDVSDMSAPNVSDDDFDADAVADAIVEPVTKLGDIWTLGRHRLMCGDSTDRETVDRLMDGKKADMVFTDPPYELDTKGGGVLKSANSMKQISDNGVDTFDPSMLEMYCKTNVFFHNKPLIKKYIELAEKNGMPFDLCFYKKMNTAPNYGGHMMTDCEYIAIIGAQSPNRGLPKETYSKCYIGQKDSGNDLSYSKPIELCAKYIKLYSNKAVLDLFGGSGSTLIACEQLNRTCYMMELDPKYCDVIIKRWETLTGQKAVLLNG